jgi:hypothetical protein
LTAWRSSARGRRWSWAARGRAASGRRGRAASGRRTGAQAGGEGGRGSDVGGEGGRVQREGGRVQRVSVSEREKKEKSLDRLSSCSLPSARDAALGKDFLFLKNGLPSARSAALGKDAFFAECHPGALSKGYFPLLCRVPPQDTRQSLLCRVSTTRHSAKYICIFFVFSTKIFVACF